MKNITTKISFAMNEGGLKWPSTLICLALLIAYPFVCKTPFLQNLGILTLMWMCLGSAWNILGGYAGQVSLGQAMFFGVGAYGIAIPFFYWRVSPWLGLLIGIAFSILLALLIALPIFKLSAQYFAIATVALGETVRIIFVNLPITGGMRGIDIMDYNLPAMFTLQFRSKLPYYFFFLALLAAVIGIMVWINCTKIGYYFRTIKANQTAAESVGINSRKYKTIALIISAVICSVCGSVYCLYIMYIDPSMVFINTISTKMIIVSVIGGVATIKGPLIGALLLIPLSEWTRAKFGSGVPGLDLVIYGVMIIIIILYQPNGLLALKGAIARRFKDRKKAAKAAGGER